MISNLKRNSLFKDSVQVLFLRIFGMVLAYIAMLLISNYYGAEVFGRYSLSLTILQFLIIFSSFGVTVSVVKLVADTNFFLNNKPLNQFLVKSLIVLVFSSIVTSVLFYFSKEFLAEVVFKDIHLISYFKGLALFFGPCLFFTFFVEFLRGKQSFKLYGLFMYILPNILLIGLIMLFYKFGFDAHFSFYSYLISLSFLAIVLLFFFPVKHFNSNLSPYRYSNLLRLSFPMMFSAAFVFLSNWTDIFMLGSMASKQDLGIYNAGYKLSVLVLVIINAFNTVLAPKIAKFYGNGEIENIKSEVQRSTQLITILSLPVVIVIVLFRRQLLLLFGPEFIEGEVVLVTFTLGLLFNAMVGSVGLVLNMTAHQKAFRTITLICAVLNIILNLILIKIYGINGAAYASVISSVILNIICVIYVKNELGFYTFKFI